MFYRHTPFSPTLLLVTECQLTSWEACWHHVALAFVNDHAGSWSSFRPARPHVKSSWTSNLVPDNWVLLVNAALVVLVRCAPDGGAFGVIVDVHDDSFGLCLKLLRGLFQQCE